MHKIIDELPYYRENILSAYIIGSYGTDYFRKDSDIDIVIILKKYSDMENLYSLKYRYPKIDLIFIINSEIQKEIKKSSSYYISALNQIMLNPRKIFGQSVEIEINRDNIASNQLYFPHHVIGNILLSNKLSITHHINKEVIEKINIYEKFHFNNDSYYSYRRLFTLVATLCSFKLIEHGVFDFSKPGKHWFVPDYLKLCISDDSYEFINDFHLFHNHMKSNVFDKQCTFYESKEFRQKLYSLIREYYYFYENYETLKNELTY